MLIVSHGRCDVIAIEKDLEMFMNLQRLFGVTVCILEQWRCVKTVLRGCTKCSSLCDINRIMKARILSLSCSLLADTINYLNTYSLLYAPRARVHVMDSSSVLLDEDARRHIACAPIPFIRKSGFTV